MVFYKKLRYTDMPGKTTQTPADSRNSGKYTKLSGESEDVEDMIFGFLDEIEFSSGSSCNSGHSYDEVDEDEDENSGNVEENKAFWESQEQLLKETLFRTNSIESKIRHATKEALKEVKSMVDGGCACRKTVANGCRKCTQRKVSDRLRNEGYNCGICKAKWMKSKEVPAGEHTYIEVLDTSNPKKGAMRVIIELNFRAEFEMVKASQEYNQLISQLPEVYVGKIERLQALIKILCSASKKCMKSRKMHIAPWRKLKYMQAKWDGVREQNAPSPAPTLPVMERSVSLPKPRVSLLSFDLSGVHSRAIKVV